MKNKKLSIFWIIYIIYIVLISGLICYGLSWLWKFLAVYEETRPVYSMEKSLHIFEESETEQLKTYLTNTVDSPYEDISTLLSVFYDSIEGRELSFGKLSGQYTEMHPVYAVLADEEHVATVSFVSDDIEVGHNLCGWKLEKISLLTIPTKSFAITVPTSMTVTINGNPISEKHRINTEETDSEFSYVNYACSGELYVEPEIKVTDRYGNDVLLQKDEATGGLYYEMSYAFIPSSMELSVGGHVLSEENALDSNIAVEELEFVQQISSHFKEYESLSEIIQLPTFRRYCIDFAFEEDDVVATDRFGVKRELQYDKATRTYSHDLISNDDLEEECVEWATSFLESYALFCAGDAKKTTLQPFFPKDSEFYEAIVSMDNSWFAWHSSLKFKNHQVQEFFAYTDNLAYVYMTIDQELVISTGKTTLTIDIPLWIVKMNDEWYLAKIIFDNSAEQ